MSSLGLQFGWIVALIVLPLLAIATVVCTRMWRRALRLKHAFVGNSWEAPDSDLGWLFAALFLGIVFIVGLFIAGAYAFPYNPHYWQIYSVKGTVLNIDTSVQSAGKSISNYYVITLSGHDEYFVTENPRILDLKGRDVDLVCHANYVYQGADNYDCNIRAIGAAS